MFRQMTVGKKIFCGFSVILVLLVFVGLIAYYSLSRASGGFTQYREMARDSNLAGLLEGNMLMIRINVKDFLITGSDQDIKECRDYLEKTKKLLEEAHREIQDSERVAKIKAVDSALKEYEAGFDKVAAFMKQRDQAVDQVLDIKGPLTETSLSEIMVSAERDQDISAVSQAGTARKHLLLARLHATKFLDRNEQKNVDRVNDEFRKLQEQLQALDKELQNPERRKMLASAVAASDEYKKAFDGVVKTIFDRNKVVDETLNRLGPEIAKNAEDVKLSIKAIQDKLGPELMAENNLSIRSISVVGLISVGLGLLFSFFITRSIVKPLDRIISGLGEGADQVASASSQVSSSSQQLAEGASEQAASIEETSSSLEEMASMTKQNAENASQANQLMTEASTVVGRANESMTRLTSSMADISRASEDTQKIIKTIDEIAFQTNLLALNAAVEAARAGEVGAGFAVVADEVRSLAMRAADAAKNTANLIEGTVKKVKEGSDLVAKTNDEFRQVAATVTKSGELVGEIAAASQEQAQGIEQVNRAVSDMDKVTQQNSANAEESASASEEMNAQAEQMKEFVASLVALVGGNGNGNGRKNHSIPIGREHVQVAVATPTSRKALAHSCKGSGKGNGTAMTISKKGSREVKPEQVIPFEDGEFKDF